MREQLTANDDENRGARPRWRALRLAAALALVALTVTAAAEAAKVKGKIANFHLLQNPVWAEAKDPKNKGYSFREIVPTVPAKYRKLFPHIPKEVCIAALAKSKRNAGEAVLVRVGGGRTTPVTIVVAPGTKLTFKNTDPFTHRLYGVNLKSFSPADTQRGGTRDWSVPEKGVFEIRDELAPSLRMWVIGEPNVAAIAYPSIEGDFRLSLPEDGEYDIQAFFAGKKVGPAVPVELKGKDLDISRQPIKVAEEKTSKKKSSKEESEDK